MFSQSHHFIIKRWTRNAKSKVILDEQVTEPLRTNSTLESLTVRYNNPSYGATKYVEAGAVSVDTYGVAISALREAMSSVLGTKRNSANDQFHTGNQKDDIGTYLANTHLLAFMKEIEEREQNLSIKIHMRGIESKEFDDQHCRS